MWRLPYIAITLVLFLNIKWFYNKDRIIWGKRFKQILWALIGVKWFLFYLCNQTKYYLLEKAYEMDSHPALELGRSYALSSTLYRQCFSAGDYKFWISAFISLLLRSFDYSWACAHKDNATLSVCCITMLSTWKFPLLHLWQRPS